MLSTNCLWLIITHLCSLHFVMCSAAICVGSSIAAGSFFAMCQLVWNYLQLSCHPALKNMVILLIICSLLFGGK